MDFDPKAVLGWIIGMASTAIIGWIGIIRRIDSKISREEFTTNIERRDSRVRDDLKEILYKLDQQNSTMLQKFDQQDDLSAEWRTLTADKMQKISEELAVIKDRDSRKRDSRHDT